MHVGIEGGSSSSNAALVSPTGELLAKIDGPHTNHWLVGEQECVKRIIDLVEKAKAAAKITYKLSSLGLALSGADSEEVCNNIKTALLKLSPDIASHVVVSNDTVGSMAAATDQGGVVLISGTGSICKLIYPDLTFHRVGGWGYMLGDEGSAYGIAYEGVKILIDHEDGFVLSKFDLTYVRKIIFDYFKITHRLELLTVFFRDFDKSHIAKLCALYAEGAVKHNDPFCKYLFYHGGFLLGRQVSAVAYKAPEEMLNRDGGLFVLCVGQVFKSWELLKEGFLEGLKPQYDRDIQIPEISLMHLEAGAAFGAACMAARDAGHPVQCDYGKNTSLFFNTKLSESVGKHA